MGLISPGGGSKRSHSIHEAPLAQDRLRVGVTGLGPASNTFFDCLPRARKLKSSRVEVSEQNRTQTRSLDCGHIDCGHNAYELALYTLGELLVGHQLCRCMHRASSSTPTHLDTRMLVPPADRTTVERSSGHGVTSSSPAYMYRQTRCVAPPSETAVSETTCSVCESILTCTPTAKAIRLVCHARSFCDDLGTHGIRCLFCNINECQRRNTDAHLHHYRHDECKLQRNGAVCCQRQL